MSDWVLKYIETLEIEYQSSEQIQTTLTFYSDVRLSPVIYQKAQIEWLSSEQIQTTITFLLRCLIEFRNISRRSEWNTEALSKFKRQ